MPIVKINSSTPLNVYNRGWNEFECKQDIDISDLEQLDIKFAGQDHNHLHLEIQTPEKKTCCLYYLKSHYKEAKYKLNW
jgi:hypothetical protein